MAIDETASDHAAALAYLHGRIDYERALMPYGGELKLERMRNLLQRLGNPQQGMPIIHIAGTKGKGSTAAMIAAALKACGIRAGLYSSPHLHRVEERVAVDGIDCTEQELCELVGIVEPVVAQMDAEAGVAEVGGATYFEILTALALLQFRRRGVGAAVLEVGLGGRLDSTNVCQPVVTVITSISYDHTRQLGNTLAQIAAEKAGIVKPGVPLISGVVEAEPRSVIVRITRERRAPLIQVGADFDYRYRPARRLDDAERPSHIDFFDHSPGRECAWTDVAIPLPGEHQGANAAVALATLAALARQGWAIDESHARMGLAALRCPARVEVVSRRPTIIVDAAHNLASISALLGTLAASFTARRRYLLFATTRDKDVQGMLALLLPRFDGIFLTRYQSNPRGVPIESLQEWSAQLSPGPCRAFNEPQRALEAAIAELRPDDLLVITGSFFIAAELKDRIPNRIGP